MVITNCLKITIICHKLNYFYLKLLFYSEKVIEIIRQGDDKITYYCERISWVKE